MHAACHRPLPLRTHLLGLKSTAMHDTLSTLRTPPYVCMTLTTSPKNNTAILRTVCFFLAVSAAAGHEVFPGVHGLLDGNPYSGAARGGGGAPWARQDPAHGRFGGTKQVRVTGLSKDGSVTNGRDIW